MAEVTLKLCHGNARKAERRFGWDVKQSARPSRTSARHTLSGELCRTGPTAPGRENAAAGARHRAIVEPHTQADPELKSARRYSNLSAATCSMLAGERIHEGKSPQRRSMRDILNRMNYRLKRIQKASL